MDCRPGFVSQSKTPQLAGVQCENCHGPAANHAANPDDPTVIPRVELAATVCGGCHSAGSRHAPPTYDEWTTSGHAAVVPDALQVMSLSTNNISSCGRCHSGSVRLALINGQNPVALTNDLNVAITCAVCHDPHRPMPIRPSSAIPFLNQLFFPVSTSAVFTNVYAANTNINLCGHATTTRGARVDRTPPARRTVRCNTISCSVPSANCGTA